MMRGKNDSKKEKKTVCIFWKFRYFIFFEVKLFRWANVQAWMQHRQNNEKKNEEDTFDDLNKK